MQEREYVCVVGAANADIEGRVLGEHRAGDSNPGSVRESAGGVGRNVAENLARLGVATTLITAVGSDERGANLLRMTSAAGVVVDNTVTVLGARTATYLSILDQAGELVSAVNDMAVLENLTPASLAKYADVIEAARAVVLDCNLAPETLAWLVEVAGGPIFVDPVSAAKAPRVSPHLSEVHTIKPNRHEAAQLASVDTAVDGGPSRAAKGLVSHGVARAFVTLGRQGMVHASAEGHGHVPAHPGQAASVTGAGDAAMAALVRCHLEGMSDAEAARFATAAASVALQSVWTVNPLMCEAAVLDAIDQVEGDPR